MTDLEHRMNIIDERQWLGLVFQIGQCLLLVGIVGVLLYKL